MRREKRQYHTESLMSRVVVVEGGALHHRSTPRDVERRRETIERTRALMTTSTLHAALRVRARATDAWSVTVAQHRARDDSDAHRGEHSRDGEAAEGKVRETSSDGEERRARGVDRCARARNARWGRGDRATRVDK